MVKIQEEFRKRLDKALEYNNMKPVELAKATGIAEATISQYRSGYSKPKDKRLVAIANVLHVDPTWLMGIDVPMVSSSPSELRPDETALLYDYNQLNDLGKKKARDDVSDLTEIPRYRIEEHDYLQPVAAHDREDILVSEDMVDVDDALMEDEEIWKKD